MEMYSKVKLLVLFVLCTTAVHGQHGNLSASRQIQLGHQYRIGGLNAPDYNKAYASYSKAADLGDPEGLNCMGIMHQLGIGIEQDFAVAYQLFEQAAAMGSGKALFNLGLIHKFGKGDQPIDYLKAFDFFVQSAESGFAGGMYGAGYFLYKGLGVPQNYELAVEWFRKGAVLGRSSCQYMLGLAYRNGYGVEKNLQEARKCFENAAINGHGIAFDELMLEHGEGDEPNLFKSEVINENRLEAPASYRKIRNNIDTSCLLNGKWKGILAVYDYGGQKIVAEKPVELHFEQEGIQFTGSWNYEGDTTFLFSGFLADSFLCFTSGTYIDPDRYDVPVDWRLEAGTLQYFKNDYDQILSGNVLMYSPYTLEPSQPMMLLLQQPLSSENKVDMASDSLLSRDGSIETLDNENLVKHTDRLLKNAQLTNSLKVYPNPAVDLINVSGDLPDEGSVLVEIYELNGKKVQSFHSELFSSGPFHLQLNIDLVAGNYLVLVQFSDTSSGRLIMIK